MFLPEPLLLHFLLHLSKFLDSVLQRLLLLEVSLRILNLLHIPFGYVGHLCIREIDVLKIVGLKPLEQGQKNADAKFDSRGMLIWQLVLKFYHILDVELGFSLYALHFLKLFYFLFSLLVHFLFHHFLYSLLLSVMKSIEFLVRISGVIPTTIILQLQIFSVILNVGDLLTDFVRLLNIHCHLRRDNTCSYSFYDKVFSSPGRQT